MRRLLPGIGQPLALLLKQSNIITDLALFDIVPVVKGVAVDISHISTPSTVTGYTKDDGGLEKALQNADVVVIPAGVPRKVRLISVWHYCLMPIWPFARTAWHDSRRSLQGSSFVALVSSRLMRCTDQCRYCPRFSCFDCPVLPKGFHLCHFKPGQLHCAHRRRGVETSRSL